MNNTEKLLRAFIEASGYEVEEVQSVESAPCNGGFCAGGDIIDYKVTKGTSKYSDGIREELRLLSDIFNCDDKESLSNFLGSDIYHRLIDIMGY
tara:strand:+ start:5930 stop:6211 length:282 start_codon:yes stop_codon:yes gene_type:complete